MIVRCGIFVIDVPPSLLVWLSIAACLIVFFAIAGRRVARLDPHEACAARRCPEGALPSLPPLS